MDFWNSILSFFKLQFGTIDSSLLLHQLVYDEKSPLIFSSGLFLFMFAIFIVIYINLTIKVFYKYIKCFKQFISIIIIHI